LQEVFGNYAAASAWLQSLEDPVSKQPYKPLQLDPDWWRDHFAGGKYEPVRASFVASLMLIGQVCP
jgi:hypothetical protein